MILFNFDISGVTTASNMLKRERREWMGSKTLHVGTAVEYAVYLEFGTSKMDAKPYFRPALVEAERDLEAFIEENSPKSMSQIGSPDELVKAIAFALERRVKEIITEKGLVDTGTLRASVAAVESEAELLEADDITNASPNASFDMSIDLEEAA